MSDEECEMMRLASTLPVKSKDIVLLKYIKNSLINKDTPFPIFISLIAFPGESEEDLAWARLTVLVVRNLNRFLNTNLFARIIDFRLAHCDPSDVQIEGSDCRLQLHHLTEGIKPMTLNVGLPNLQVYERVAALYGTTIGPFMKIIHNGVALPFTGFFADFDPEDDMILYVTMF